MATKGRGSVEGMYGLPKPVFVCRIEHVRDYLSEIPGALELYLGIIADHLRNTALMIASTALGEPTADRPPWLASLDGFPDARCSPKQMD